jgi:hypothetical protein
MYINIKGEEVKNKINCIVVKLMCRLYKGVLNLYVDSNL